MRPSVTAARGISVRRASFELKNLSRKIFRHDSARGGVYLLLRPRNSTIRENRRHDKSHTTSTARSLRHRTLIPDARHGLGPRAGDADGRVEGFRRVAEAREEVGEARRL